MAVCSAAIGVHALNPRAEPVQLLQSPAVSSVLAAAIKVDPAEKQVKVAAPTSSCSQLHPSAATVGDGCVIGLKPSSCSVAGCGTLPHGCNPGAGSSGMAEATATASSPECEAGSAAPCISFAYGLGGGCCREGCEKALGKSGVRVAARWEHPFAVAKAEGPSKCGTDAVKSEDCDKGECSRLRLDTAANAVAKDPGMQRQGAGTEAIGVVHGCLQDCSGPHKESDQIGDARNDPRITSGTDGQPPGCPAQSSSLANRPCGRRAQAHLLSAEDGYAPVLSVARTGGVCSCCGAVILLKSGPYREGLSRLRSQMAELAGPAVLVQPELVLVVGPVLTLAGFPPLQVAASEILHLGPSRGLNRARVDAALAKFLRTEQRFGS
ncbi:hypothetical protein Vretimale_5829 [Volvox reticuliferus]|nr:hypothetical protein Vretifemale_5902 [Volvox reticuliferus]GIM01004.1 hypothetical protein Vretimale_5829 [Volvox reticuliferus]